MLQKYDLKCFIKYTVIEQFKNNARAYAEE